MNLRRSSRCLALLACLATSAAPAADDLIVLTVDVEYLESGMPLYASIADQAEQAQRSVDGTRRSEIELARDLRQSEVLTALPEAITEVALAANADLVLDREVARRVGEASARDVTQEVERILVAQFSTLPLEPGT
ncbi:MAG TPA: hypothetical protein VN259_05855 [Xanthomonadales bacterium]|nr:hypothetical protein [Xanthomonadales bacterium]